MKKPSTFKFKVLLPALAMAATVSFAPHAHADKMDNDTDSMVIEKLQNVLAAGQMDGISRAPIQVRLGDVLAERARLTYMQEAEKSCDGCLGSQKDRQAALENYQSAFKAIEKHSDQLSEEIDRGAVLLQMAHLHELLNQKPQALALYKKAIEAGHKLYDNNVLSNSYLGVADDLFTKAKFAEAMTNYEKAEALATGSQKGFIMYRQAWCRLNQGQLDQGKSLLKKILMHNELMTRQTSTGAAIDTSFQEDVSRDLATFYARGSVTDKDIEDLMNLTPPAARKTNMAYLATETERLGNKKASLHVWALYAEKNASPQEKLEVMVRGTRLQYDLGDKKMALQSLQKSTALWAKNGCNDATSCPNLKINLRKVVGDWAQSEKKQPTRMLLSAYEAYMSLFADDIEIRYWAASAARQLKETRLAAQYYSDTANLAAKNPTDKNSKDMFEPALLAEVDMAESTKDAGLRDAAYHHYIRLNPNGPKAFEMRYQVAYMAYDAKRLPEAANAFQLLALDPTCRSAKANKELCAKSADLALDTLVALHDDVRLELWARQFAQVDTARKDVYLKIARTSVLKQSAAMAEQNEAQKALDRLANTPMEGATESEKINYFKTRIAYAEKAQNMREVANSARLLGQMKLSASDQDYVIERQAWAAEMNLDFATAYRLSTKMKMAKYSAGDRELRLALLAELAGMDPSIHEQAYLRQHPQGQKANAIRVKTVRNSRAPKAELERQLPFLKKDMDLLAPVALEVFSKTNDMKFAQQMLNIRGMKNQPAGLAMFRALYLRDEAADYAKLARNHINTKSDAAVARSLGERLNLLGKQERETQIAVASGDWIAQAISLTHLANENKRTYQEIMGLPVPRKLKPAQQAQYRALVAQKAQIYLQKATAIQLKTDLLWDNLDRIKSMLSEYEESRTALKPVFARQLQVLASVAPTSRRTQIEGSLRAENERANVKELAEAKADVSAKPFDPSRLRRLMDVERKQGPEKTRDTMVAYLDARLTKLQGAKAL